MATVSDQRPEIPELPADIGVEYISNDWLPGDPPDIQLSAGGIFRDDSANRNAQPEPRIFQLPGQRMLVIGDRYIMSFSRDKLHIFVRPENLDKDHLRQFLRKQRATPAPTPAWKATATSLVQTTRKTEVEPCFFTS